MFDLSKFKIKKVYIIGTIFIVVLSGSIILYRNIINKDKTLDFQEEILIKDAKEGINIKEKEEDKDEDIIIIHVTGEVRKSGIVKLKNGARIEDAINAAGGLTENADITDVNLAYVLEDGCKLNIPSKSEEMEDIKLKENIILDKESGNVIGDRYIEDMNVNQTKNIKININKSTKEQLEKIPGIGAVLAERIIEYRNENGNFKNIEELKQVNGIGENKFNNIKEYICSK